MYSRIILKFALINALFLFGKKTTAQDIHFSQFYNAPFNLNPALTGRFDGAYRFIANQRTQWRSITVPYSTFALTADARRLTLPDGVLNKKDGKALPTGWNLGLNFYSDKAGDSRMKTNMIQLAAAGEIALSDRGIFSPALMLGYTGMSIDYSELQYDNQWNGLVFDPGIDAGEQFARNARGYMSAAIGGLLDMKAEGGKKWSAGFSLFNLTLPKQSFFDDNNVKLNPRTSVHAQYLLPLNRQWQAEPLFSFYSQGSYKEMNIGGRCYYLWPANHLLRQALYAGVVGRARDAGYVVLGIQFDHWEAGISYDINTSNLKPASSGRGGLEFSLIYLIPPPPVPYPVRVCRDWI